MRRCALPVEYNALWKSFLYQDLIASTVHSWPQAQCTWRHCCALREASWHTENCIQFRFKLILLSNSVNVTSSKLCPGRREKTSIVERREKTSIVVSSWRSPDILGLLMSTIGDIRPLSAINVFIKMPLIHSIPHFGYGDELTGLMKSVMRIP